MKREKTARAALAGMGVGIGLLLSACGGGGGSGGSSGPTTTSISGTAASGLALTSGLVELSCKDGLKKTGINISANGTWGTTVPTANLPCVVKASDGTSTYYSFTVGDGSSIITNVTPLTTLTLAKLLQAVPSASFANLSATDLAKLNEAAINAAIAAFITAFDGYALPGNFNPVTSALTAATGSQSGNDHDRLLEQLKAANPDLDTLVSAAATGTMPTPAAPSHTPATASFSEFFSTFAGDYTLAVADAGAESANNAAVKALFPANSARIVHIESNGDVSVAAEGRILNYLATSYSAVGDRFSVSASTNTVRYRAGGTSNGNCCDLYINYDASNGKLQVDVQGFVNNEGYASLKGVVLAPSSVLTVVPSAPPTLTGFTPSSGAVGDTVTLTGTHFSTTLANNIVRFTGSTGTGIQATVVSGSGTQLVVTVPAGAQTGGLTVYNGDAVTTSSDSFTVSTSGGGSGSGGSSSTPTTPAAKLAAAFGAGFSGTYVFNCSGASHTVTVYADGSSLIDSTPLVGTTGYGRVEISSANTITGKYYVSLINNSSGLSANLYFNGDAPDTSTGWDIKPLGESYAQFCTLVSAPTARFNRLNALKTLAPFSASLTCTASAPAASAELADGAQAFNLAADGSLTLGGLSASTTQAGRSSLQVSFSNIYATSDGNVWYEPAFYSPVSAATNTRYLDVRLAGDGSVITSAKFYGTSGSNSQCVH